MIMLCSARYIIETPTPAAHQQQILQHSSCSTALPADETQTPPPNSSLFLRHQPLPASVLFARMYLLQNSALLSAKNIVKLVK
jgi:hypothetical protein